MTPLPRYFVPRSGPLEQASGEPPPIMQIIDSFLIGASHLVEMDCVVGVDALGDLQMCGRSAVSQMDEILQGQLTFNELSCQSGRRILSLTRFYLFAMQLLEQPGDSPGINDPIYLYGKLFGLFPNAANTVGVEGQLTVTRADVLHGIAESARYGFTYAVGTNHSALATRCFHFLAPGDNESDLNKGAGVVIVYPLPTAELAATDPSNELTVKQMLFDVLQSLKKDLQANNVQSKLSNLELPIPSRQSLEMNLEARGYKVKGNLARRAMSASSGSGPLDNVLSNLYGKLSRDRLDLPPEGSLDDFLEITRKTIQSIKGWPPEKNKVLARLCRTATPDEIARASQTIESETVKVSKTPQRPASMVKNDELSRPFVRRDAPVVNAGPPDWMKDFMKAHMQSSSVITQFHQNAKSNAASAQSQNSSPKKENTLAGNSDWVKDFDSTISEIKNDKTKPEENKKAPDWMADFQ